MSITESGLRRVTVYTDRAHADLTLPAAVPVAALIVGIADLVPHRESLRPYRLCEPGRSALDGTRTLAQHGIPDGAVLVLTHTEGVDPDVVFDDPAEQVAAGVRAAARPWTPVARRLTAALAASVLVGVAGFAAVPGGPGLPNALLGVAAAGTVALLAVPPSGCGSPARIMLCCLAGLAVLFAVVGMAVAVTGISVQAAGSAAGVVAVGLIRVAGRVAAGFAGLSRRPDAAPPRVDCAHDLLSGLVAASAVMVVLGTAGAVAGAPVSGVPRTVGVVFAAVAGATLVLRARSHTDGVQIAILVAGGVAATGIALLAAVSVARPCSAAVAVTLAGAALGVGFTGARSPVARRGAEVLEGLALGSLVPLACWLCGVYGVARGLSLG
ncbi:EsaB/YukD family protein [Mycolicibacter longobardus]|uniref:EccD-like transmembrane domain-containing protein n=1 Tax=Mycolicibacter longobardus TaxID=1108812 RepID=A0A1X1YRK5_9MYCO|nr:EsaB/YukD family protein [Mycolicibacter longobardus]MCV7383488.1 hypothetical protein [Mycolicibacter longobardus]ORW13736.1 hypothetical protein AWC16_02900 [Mycolicibacter longobardus]